MTPESLALLPDLTGTKPLVESVGYARALEICFTARMVGAAEAGVSETKTLLRGATERGLEEQRRLEREAQVRRFRELAAPRRAVRQE